MKVLVVEDEYCSRISLVKQIKEYKSQYNIKVFEAEDGKQAFSVFMQEKPGLVITDIKMPYINGLELMKMIYQTDIDTKVIMVSGYAEFDYVQTAINSGAMGYLLKPINDNDLFQLLDKYIDEKSQRTTVKNHDISLEVDTLESNIISQRILEWALMDNMIFDQHLDSIIHKAFDRYIIGLILFRDYGKFSEVDIDESFNKAMGEICEFKAITMPTNQLMRFIIIKKDNSIEVKRIFDKIAKMFLCEEVKFYIGVSGDYEGVFNIKKAYQEALLALNNKIFFGRSVSYFAEGCTENKFQIVLDNEHANTIQLYIEMGESKKAYSLIESLINTIFMHESPSLENLEAFLKKLEIVLNETALKAVKDNAKLKTHNLHALEMNFDILDYDSKEELLDVLEQKLTKLCEFICSTDEDDINSSENIVALVMKYIEENYYKDLKLKDLAENVLFMNSSYLSYLIRTKTGKNFTTYLNEVRMKKALELLRDKNSTVTEVSLLCGYNDISQFIQVFKKKYGKTPKQYQNSLFSC